MMTASKLTTRDRRYLVINDGFFSTELPWSVYRLYGEGRAFAGAYATEDDARAALAKAQGGEA